MEFWNIDLTNSSGWDDTPQNHNHGVSLLAYLDFFFLVVFLAAFVAGFFVLLVLAAAFFLVGFAGVFLLAAGRFLVVVSLLVFFFVGLLLALVAAFCLAGSFDF
jgi:hypothetical protein